MTTNLYFLIPSPLHPFHSTPLPSGNNQNILCIRDSIIFLVFLVYFLDSIVDRYVVCQRQERITEIKYVLMLEEARKENTNRIFLSVE